MKKESGQGFSRRVTLNNLEQFAKLLLRKSDSTKPQSEEGEKSERVVDTALVEAEKLFQGTSLKYKNTLKRIARKRTPKSDRISGKSSSKPKPKIAKPAALPQAPKITATDKPRGALLWEKKLTDSDAQRPPSKNTKPTGGVRLTQEDWEVDGDVIDQTKYFRYELFGNFIWQPNAKKSGREDTAILFDITLPENVRYRLELTVSHMPSREAKQHNYTTMLHWGGLSQLVRKDIDLRKKTLRLYASAEGTTEPFFIKIL